MSQRSENRRGGMGIRIGKALMMLGVTTVLVAACTGRTSSSTGEGEDVVVQFLGSQPAGYFDEVIEAFEEEHEDIKVEYSSVPFEQMNTTLQSRLGGKDESLDVLMVDTPRVSAMASRDLLEPLDDYADEVRSATSESAAETTSWNGKQVAFPLWTSTQLLYYNTDLLAGADISEPPTDTEQRWTWEELVDAAEQAQAGGAKHGFTFEQVDRFYQLQPLPASLGGGNGLVGDDGLDVDVTNPEWETAMTWYGELFSEKLSPRGVDSAQTPQLFADGDAAFFVGGTHNLTAFGEAKGLNYGIAPMPSFADGEPVTPTGSWSIGVNPAAGDKDEALEFAEFMTLETAGARASGKDIARIPQNSEAYDEWAETASSTGTATEGMADLVEYELANTAVDRPVSVGYIDFETAMNSAFSDIRNGSDVGRRLEQAQQELERDLETYRSEGS